MKTETTYTVEQIERLKTAILAEIEDAKNSKRGNNNGHGDRYYTNAQQAVELAFSRFLNPPPAQTEAEWEWNQ